MKNPDAERGGSVIRGHPAAFFRNYAAMLVGTAAFFALMLSGDPLGSPLRPLLGRSGILVPIVAVSAMNLFFAWRCVRYIRWFKKHRGACCFRCGYSMRDTTICPECGRTRDVGKLAAHWRGRCHDGFLWRSD